MLNKNKVIELIKETRKNSTKRNFKQTFDLTIKLSGIDLKKTEQHVDFYTTLHYSKGKQTKLCALVGLELHEEAKKIFDTTILVDDFSKYSDKKKLKELASEHEFFIAQANIMPKVAQTFGKVLGTRGKMPNPKAGCVVPPKTNLTALYEKLQKTVRMKAKTALMFQVAVGNEDMDDAEIADNIITAHSQAAAHLPNHENNISKVLLKLTMSKPVEIK